MLTALLFSAVTSAQAVPSSTVATPQDVASSAALCLLSAGKKGVDRSRFANSGWVNGGERGVDYRHEATPITIEMPKDNDGQARICVVKAVLASQASQDQLSAEITKMLKTKPFKQTDSLIWMVSMNGHRGIQLYVDKQSPQPSVRLIGAEF